MTKNAVDVYELEPQVIDHLISPHTEIMRNALDSYWIDRREGKNSTFGPVLIYGAPFQGKRLAANIMASELGVELREIITSGMWRSADVAEALHDAHASSQALLVLCELAPLPPGFQDCLYYAIHHGVVTTRGNMGDVTTTKFDKSRCPLFVVCPLPEMSERLLSQFRLVLRFQGYSADHMNRIIEQRLSVSGWTLADEALPKIVAYAKGRPGIAMHILNVAHMIARAEDKNSIRTVEVNKAWGHLRTNWPKMMARSKSKAK